MSSDFNQRVLPSATIVVFIGWLFITNLSRQPDHLSIVSFLSAATFMLVATTYVIWHYYKCNQPIPFRWIIITAVLLRLISLFGLPLFEDDYYRYMWDGYQTVTTNDPYTLAPSIFFDREDYPEIFDSVLSLINYPEIATVYGPVTQWVFALGYLIQPAAIWPLQLTAGIADISLIIILFKLGAGRALLLYAWSPLILKEFSLTAHPDIYAIFLMVLSIYMVRKGLIWTAGIALALAVGAKVFAILALPYLLCQKWSWRFWVVLCGWFLATIALITVAFGTVTVWTPEGLRAMADSWLFNSAVYLVLLELLSFQTIKLMLLSIFATYILITCLWRLRNAHRDSSKISNQIQTEASPELCQNSNYAFRGDWLFMIFLMALPVVNAWYVAWLIPFATLYPRWWSWGMSYFCLLSYVTGANLGQSSQNSLDLPNYIVAIEYTAVGALVLLALVMSSFLPRYKVASL